MERPSRNFLPAIVLLGSTGIVSLACANIMGVEEPILVDSSGKSADGTDPADGGSVHTPESTASVECTSAPTDTCPDGRYCLPSHECAPGCETDAECNALTNGIAPHCNTSRHQCVACLSNADCTALNQECSPAGTCAERCSGPEAACPAGTECCNKLCVDIKNDVFSCGSCSNPCGGTTPLCCNGLCKDAFVDRDNCGTCSNRCVTTNGTPSCSGGSCRWTCTAGFSHCAPGNTGCETPTSNDVARCGSCTNDCRTTVKNATGISCSESKCTYATCTAPFADCDSMSANGCECTCGKPDAVCCDGSTCDVGLSCQNGRCKPCETLNGPCSSSSECCSGNCNTSAHKCK